MTLVTISRKDGETVGIKSEGHSGYAESGSDIVCAAISTLMQALTVGIQDVCGLQCKVREGDAFFEVEWDFDTAKKIRTLSQTIELSLKGIAASYPCQKFLKIMEVQL